MMTCYYHDFTFELSHRDEGDYIEAEIEIMNKQIQFYDSISCMISKELMSRAARNAADPHWNDDLLEIGDVGSCGCVTPYKGYIGSGFLYEFWAYEDKIFVVDVKLENCLFECMLDDLGIREWDR